MKIQSIFSWVYKRITGERKTAMFNLVQQQRFLLRQGLEATAEVMDASLIDEKVGSQFPVRLWLKLRKSDGSYIYTYSNTLVPLSHVPGKGEVLRIKYLPDNLSIILII